jgi:N-acetylmuramoyl-L-alanine amidase
MSVTLVGLAALGAGCTNAANPGEKMVAPTVRHRPQTSEPQRVRGTTATSTTTTTKPSSSQSQILAGKVVGIDPGHNGLNYADPSYIDQQIFNGRTEENCNTTGTETDSGYTEAEFNFNVAQYLASDLESKGAQVVLTRNTNAGVGPCVNVRAQILNDAHVNVAIAIHADGGPPGGRGFAILEPVADGPNNGVIEASKTFGDDVRSNFLSITGMPLSTYDGTDGIAFRDDLAGLNLTSVPTVLIECGNMRNATDASMLITSSFQQQAALALATAITAFLT